MFVLVTPEGASLREPADVRSLKVVVDGVDAAGVPGHLSPFGRIDPAGDHAWLSVKALRAHAVVPDGATEADLDGMLAFAAKHGWVDGDAVRAHLEIVDPETDATPDGGTR